MSVLRDRRGLASLEYAFVASMVIIAVAAATTVLAPTIAALMQRLKDVAAAGM